MRNGWRATVALFADLTAHVVGRRAALLLRKPRGILGNDAASKRRRPRRVGAKGLGIEVQRGSRRLLLRGRQRSKERRRIGVVRVKRRQAGEQFRTRHNMGRTVGLPKNGTKGSKRCLDILV